MASLKSHPAWDELRRWTHQQRDQYLVNLAGVIFADPDKVTEAALREKAAFFRGMNTLLNEPFFSAKALERAAEKANKEQ